MKNKKTLIAIATAWGPKYGGINAFNYDLLIALAAAHWSWLQVVCVVAESSDDEVQQVLDQYQISLINLKLSSGSIDKEYSSLIWSTIQSKGLSFEPENLVFLGHDRITGAVAIELANTYGGRSALIHHMSYAHYESFAENSAASRSKQIEQEQLLSQADMCLAVGPLLQNSAAQMLDCQISDIPMLIPGLADITPRQNQSTTFIAFVSGRLDTGAQKIKQAHLGVAGFADAVQRCDRDTGLPDVLRGENEPRLVLRGIDLEVALNTDLIGAEVELKEIAQDYAGRAINIQALPFTQDRVELFDDLKKASVCLMPSWHEGFGLVAWEAIAAGVPLIVSKKSGVYRFLKELRKDNLIHPIDVKGQFSPPFFSNEDKENISTLLIKISKNLSSSRSDALRLREELQNDYQWRACADAFLEALSWHTPTEPLFKKPSHKNPTTKLPSSETILDQWLVLPTQLWQRQNGLSPSLLLKAEEEFIPFAPERFQFLQTQIEWAKTQNYSICVRLLTGDGGIGKTRLALEMCKRLLKDGWTTGFLKNDFHARSVQNFARELLQIRQPILLVIDYAETRTAELLELLIAVSSQRFEKPIRILLLARSSGEWWAQLPTYDIRCEALLEGSATTGPYSLPSLYEQVSERKRAFDQALAAFAEALNVTPPCIQPDLSAEQYKSPLFLQMAALLNLLGEHTNNAESLPQSLVRHEQRYWRKLTAKHAQPGIELSNDSENSLLMSLATLIGGSPTSKAIEPIWVAAEGRGHYLKPLFASLSQFYPGRQGLAGLQPDLLGEALVSRQILGAEGQALLNAVLGAKASTPQRTHALTILARILLHRSDVSTAIETALAKQFVHCAKSLFDVCIQTPGPLSLVAEQSFKQLSTATALQVAGILEPNFKYEVLPLAGLRLLISETLKAQASRRCEKPRPSIKDWHDFSNSLHVLSIANSRIGETYAAISHAKHALDIRQRLASSNPGNFESYLATSLDSYAGRLSDVGEKEQALIFSQKALNIRTILSKNNPKRFKPALAVSLNNHSNWLSDVGEISQALEFSKQALLIQEQLAKDTPELFEADFAISLNNHAGHLYDSGDTSLALNFAKKALEVRQRLAKDKPERFEANWATSLSNYATLLSDIGETDQSLDYIKESLTVHQRLAKDKPDRFEPDLAASLSNYAHILSDIGETKEALTLAKQASLIFQRLVAVRPSKFMPDFYISQIFVSFLQWLDGEEILPLPSTGVCNEEIPYDMRPPRFYKLVLQTLGNQEATETPNLINSVWKSWSEMSKSQKTHWKAHYLVICAYAQANGCLDIRSSNWLEQLETFRQQRNGKLPHWMTQIAERKSFAMETRNSIQETHSPSVKCTA